MKKIIQNNISILVFGRNYIPTFFIILESQWNHMESQMKLQFLA